MSGESTRRDFLRNGVRGVVALGLGTGYFNTTSYGGVRLREVPVNIRDLPDNFRGFTIGLISDTHAGLIANNSLFDQAAILIMEKKPDVIALTGDYISGATKSVAGSIGGFHQEYLDRLIRAFAPLKAPHGIFAVLGNHDFWSGQAAVEAVMSGFTGSIGAQWLRNESRRIERGGQHLNILGVDDYWHSCSLNHACARAGTDAPNILLSHNPDINGDVFPQMRIDLILSGHTHGGQVVLPVIGCPVAPSKFGQKYLAGLVRDGERQTYITHGVGHLMAPIRLNCPPEVAVIKLV